MDLTMAPAPDSAGSGGGLPSADTEISEVLPSRASEPWPEGQSSPWGGTSSRGRHRKAARLSGPLALAVAVTTVLGLFGIAAAVLPPSFASMPGPAASEGTVADAGGVAGSDPLLGAPPTVTAPVSPTTAAAPTSTAPTTPPTAARPRVAPTASPIRKPPPPPPPTKSQPSPRVTGGGSVTQADQVLAIVNQERAANGCGAVTINQKLATAAELHSQDQAAHNTMSHTGSDGSSPWDRAAQAGYQWAIGENVAAGYRTPAEVMAGWMNSPGHRANILNCQAKAIGIGVAAAGDGTLYWTQMFGTQP
jgi:uncharacterized protein YkwD